MEGLTISIQILKKGLKRVKKKGGCPGMMMKKPLGKNVFFKIYYIGYIVKISIHIIDYRKIYRFWLLTGICKKKRVQENHYFFLNKPKKNEQGTVPHRSNATRT